MYTRVVTSTGKRSLKKLSIQVRQTLIKESRILETNPMAGEKLSGSLNFLYSFHFKYKNVDYRCAYTIQEDKKLIEIHFADVRENFYQKLRRIFR
ncbi:MAG: type II toxin-antitoxin system RelE/ParE family toxin [bacterium]|nr:type II toxin-antitoxin system RelE/ParE family toxin [bacterium]